MCVDHWKSIIKHENALIHRVVVKTIASNKLMQQQSRTRSSLLILFIKWTYTFIRFVYNIWSSVVECSHSYRYKCFVSAWCIPCFATLNFSSCILWFRFRCCMYTLHKILHTIVALFCCCYLLIYFQCCLYILPMHSQCLFALYSTPRSLAVCISCCLVWRGMVEYNIQKAKFVMANGITLRLITNNHRTLGTNV